jgi:hypothetical protein
VFSGSDGSPDFGSGCRVLFRATSSLARAVVPAVVQQAAVDPQRVAYRLLAAAVVRQFLAAAEGVDLPGVTCDLAEAFRPVMAL